MTECKVLRCQQASAGVFTYNTAPLMQAGVCSDHLRRLEAGEAWLLDTEGFHIRMGDDVPPSIIGSSAAKSLDGRGMIELELETPHVGRGPQSISLMISAPEARALRNLLAPFVGVVPDVEEA